MAPRRIFSQSIFIIWSTVGVLILLVVGVFLINKCDYGGGMAASYWQCECLGYEWEVYDQTPADGPRKTLCLGVVQSITCYQFIGGPTVDCVGERS